MKKGLIILVAMCGTLFTYSQYSKSADIELEITNIKGSEGKLMIGLYKNESNWLKTLNKGIIGKIEDGKCIAVFKDIPNGTYAISLFHDENNNNQLDMYIGLIPKEDTACSNNAPAKFGPPKWTEAKFELNGETIKQTIKF